MTQESMKRTVVNLTPFELTSAQFRYIFFLSHSFAPTPPLLNLSIFERDLDGWFSKLRYRENVGNK